MNDKEFGELIRRCLSGEVNQEETALLEKWLDWRSEKDPHSELSDSEKEKMRMRFFKNISSKMMKSFGSVPKSKSSLKATGFYRIAAAVVVLCVLSYAILKKFANSSGAEKIAIVHSVLSADVDKKVVLSDGSIVWLKGSSSILYPEKFNGDERNVTLTGEALFEVSKDADHPFIIQCGGLTAKVLGTSFNIKATETNIEVLVLTGKVALSSKGNTTSLIVHPNEKAVFSKAQNHMTKVMANENEKTAKTARTQYSMRFDATTMNEIIGRIEGKFDVSVLLGDERLSNCTITADFTDQSLDRTLSMIAQALGIEYEINNHQVTLRGAGCN